MEDGKLKRRLIGAAVLILLAVIFIPKLLEKNDPFPISGNDVPSSAETEFTSKVTPLDSPSFEDAPTPTEPSLEPPAMEAETTADSMSLPEPVPAESVPMEPVPEIASADTTEPTSSSEPAEESTSPALETPTATGWVVQVGSFRSEKNAVTLRDRLLDKGYQAFIDESTDADGKSLRVRIGPETDRPAANALRDKLEQELKLKGLVKPYPS